MKQQVKPGKRRIWAAAGVALGTAMLVMFVVWFVVAGFAVGLGVGDGTDGSGSGTGADGTAGYESGDEGDSSSSADPADMNGTTDWNSADKPLTQEDILKKTHRSTKIVKIAAQQIGNFGGKKYWSWYGYNSRVEWCACFVSWCADRCGYISAGVVPKFSAVVEGVGWFRDRERWRGGSYTPLPGDIIFFDWKSDGLCDHVGIVEKCDGTRVYTIEGNSLNMCRRKSYPVGSPVIYGYGVPKI